MEHALVTREMFTNKYQAQALIYNDFDWIIYLNGGIDIEPGEEPGISTLWTKQYSLEPDTDFVYPGVNPIVQMNGSYYLCNSNTNELLPFSSIRSEFNSLKGNSDKSTVISSPLYLKV